MAKPATRFRAKTWIFWAQAIFCGSFCLFGLIMGPVLYTVGARDQKNRKLQDAGFWITIVTVGLFVPGLVKAVFNIVARRKPLLRLAREGIEVRLVGRSSLDGIPGMPNLLRFAWGVLSGQAFRSHVLFARWDEMHGARVEGLPAMRILILHGTFRNIDNEPVGDEVIFPQVEFKQPLQEIARAISAHAANPSARAALPGGSGGS